MSQTKHICRPSSKCWSLFCNICYKELGLRASSWPVLMAPEFRKKKRLCSELLQILEPSEIKCLLLRSIWMKSRSCKSDQFVPLEITETKTGHPAHPIRTWLLDIISRWHGREGERRSHTKWSQCTLPMPLFLLPPNLSYSLILSALYSSSGH